MRLRYIALIVVGFCLIRCTSRESKLRTIISEQELDSLFNGVVFVKQGEKVLLHEQVYDSNLQLPVPNDSSVIQLASLTKLFTKLTILKMVERGTLELDSSISHYRPDFRPAFGERISLIQLLKMTSGLPRELDEQNILTGVSFDSNGMAGHFLDSMPEFDLIFPPGEKEAYSNLNYWILGAIIESTSNQTLEQAYARYVFQPLGMTQSGISRTPNSIPGYSLEENEWVKDERSYASRYASGGAFSSLNDLRILSESLLEDDFINPSDFPRVFTADHRYEYYGSLPSVTNTFLVDRKNNLTLIALNNIGVTRLDAITDMKLAMMDALSIEREESRLKKRVVLEVIDSLKPEVPLEAGMREWVSAIQTGTARDIYEVINTYSLEGEMVEADETWGEIVAVRDTLPNFDVVGYRWVEAQEPQGLEVWFDCQGPEKVAFRWIPSRKHPNKVENLMVIPDDMDWLGEHY